MLLKQWSHRKQAGGTYGSKFGGLIIVTGVTAALSVRGEGEGGALL